VGASVRLSSRGLPGPGHDEAMNTSSQSTRSGGTCHNGDISGCTVLLPYTTTAHTSGRKQCAPITY
jgi:hypothetical protein